MSDKSTQNKTKVPATKKTAWEIKAEKRMERIEESVSRLAKEIKILVENRRKKQEKLTSNHKN